MAKPDEDLPKNRLVKQLAVGLTMYVQKVWRRESYYVNV